jgi:hypothetical protein
MTRLRDDLFRLLPLVYQQRDAEPGSAGALQALLEVLGEQGDVVAADLGRLYDDWFIETCADWLVPYLGDLLGVRLLHPVGPGAGRSRALVGKTLDYRRRKGTVAGLEELAYDVTGWPAAAEEYFLRLCTTQHLAHPRARHAQAPDLRRAADLELSGGPFAPSAHTGEVRRLPTGRFGIDNIGLHVWRLQPNRVTRATARPAADPADGRYLVDPVGLPVPLVNPGVPEEDITSLAAEHHVPAFLRRRALYDELEGVRDGSVDEPRWFGADPVVEVFADFGAGVVAVPVTETTAADLGDPVSPTSTGWPRPAAPLTVAVDPVLGRLAFRAGLAPSVVEVTASYASPGLVGAGPYDRSHPATTELLAGRPWFRAVGAAAAPVADAVHTTIADAVADWSAEPPGSVGVIAIIDSRTYAEDLVIDVPAGSRLLLVAATWPDAEHAADPGVTLDLSDATAADRRPHLLGSVTVTGTPGGADAVPGELAVDGLLVEGDVTVAPGDLGRLTLRHVTVAPARGGVQVAAPTGPDTDNGHLTVEVTRSIVGPVQVPDRGPALVVSTSIVDGGGGGAIDAPAAPVALDQVTGLGPVNAERLDASDCVLDGAVTVDRRQQGCVRFSFLAEGAVAPRRYRCQPDLALTGVNAPGEALALRTRLAPVFTSTTYGDSGYGRLDDRCHPALRTGASNGAAMGAFAELMEPQRLSNLAAVLEEYLRLGLDAGVIHET